jgi:hypothetical protein
MPIISQNFILTKTKAPFASQKDYILWYTPMAWKVLIGLGVLGLKT